MRIPNSYRRGAFGFNMTPMIDVVFQLIIFFLVSSQLVKQESQMPLTLPVADSGPVAVDDERPRVIVNVLPDGRILLAGSPVTSAVLERRLANQYAEFRRTNPDRDDLEIRIRSDRSVPYQMVEPILLACARAGIWNVTFAVYRSDGK
jgi:biopolymer transport protein ExbD